MVRRTREKSGRSGAAAVETAVVLTVFLMILLAIVEYGRFTMIRQLLDNAAREGARQAVSGTSTLTTADIQAIVTNYLAGQGLQGLTISVYQADPATGALTGAWTDAAFGAGIAVQASGTYTTMLPNLGFLPSSFTLTTTVIMRSEAN
jgi:Flp pilus assembly protein TadG